MVPEQAILVNLPHLLLFQHLLLFAVCHGLRGKETWLVYCDYCGAELLNSVEGSINAYDLLYFRGVTGIEIIIFMPERNDYNLNFLEGPDIFGFMNYDFCFTNTLKKSRSQKSLQPMDRLASKYGERLDQRLYDYLGDLKVDCIREILSLVSSSFKQKKVR